MKGKTSLSFTSSFVCTWESYLMPFYFYFKKEIFLFAIFFSSFHSNKKRNNREACSRRSPRCPIFVFGAIIVLDLKRKKIIYSLFKKPSRIAGRKSSDIESSNGISLDRKSFDYWTTLKYKHPGLLNVRTWH